MEGKVAGVELVGTVALSLSPVPVALFQLREGQTAETVVLAEQGASLKDYQVREGALEALAR